MNSNKADKKFEKIYNPITETIDKTIPKIRAWSLVIFPVGIGLRQVLVINLSRSASYHIFNAPAAPAPIVTKKIQIKESNKGILFGDVNNPTAHVKITRDITLGFINCIKDLKNEKVLKEKIFLFKVFVVTFIQHSVIQKLLLK